MDEQETKRFRFELTVGEVEHHLEFLTLHATELDTRLSRRLLEALVRFGEARKQLISPLARIVPQSNARN